MDKTTEQAVNAMTPEQLRMAVAVEFMGYSLAYNPDELSPISNTLVYEHLKGGLIIGEPYDVFNGIYSHSWRNWRPDLTLDDCQAVIIKLMERGDLFMEWWRDDEWFVCNQNMYSRKDPALRLETVVARSDKSETPSLPQAICRLAVLVARME